MKALIFGATGMLGHKLFQVLSEQMAVWATIRSETPPSLPSNLLPTRNMITRVVAEDLGSVKRVLDISNPNVVINALGIVKQRDEAKKAVPSILVNSLFPHQLADICLERGIRLVQISTDCVFSGLRGNYSEIDNPDPVDLYGRSKLLGELNRSGCLTLRTSIIGWQLTNFTSLLSWFAMQRGKRIKGYRKAIYSGFSTLVLSTLISDIITTRPDLQGVYHVASKPISKYDLLLALREALGWRDITIEPDENFFCDRSLNGSRFLTSTGWISPPWELMISELANEWDMYSSIYHSEGMK